LSTNDWATIKLHIDEVVARIESIKPGEFAQHNVGPVIE